MSSSLLPVSSSIQPQLDVALVVNPLKETNYEEAFHNLLLIAPQINDQTEVKSIKELYSLLFTLLPHLKLCQIEQELYLHVIPQLNRFPLLVEEQFQLAMQLGKCYLGKNDFSAACCLAKAYVIAREHHLVYEELSQYVSQVFTHFIQKHFLESTDFADQLDRSRGDPIAFSRMIDRIDALKKYCFFQPSIIHELYRKARDSFNRINSTIRNQLGDLSNRIASGLSWQSNQKENLLVGLYYVLAEWRTGFSSCPSSDSQMIREFQREKHKAFIQFFEEILLKEAFILIGEPPCHYDIRAMGSLGRQEGCPYSDLEGVILIEDLKHLPYFKKLEECLKLQIALLGETAPTNLPVFSCLGSQHKSGFHLDQDFAVGDPVTLAAYQKPKAQAYDPASLEHMLQKTTSLSQNTAELFNIYQAEIKKVLNQADREKRALELFRIRLEDYQKAWKIPVEQLKEADLKKEFVEVLNHLIADIALYFGLEPTNTLDIIEALDETLFPKETKELLKEAVSTIYQMRIRLHLDSKEQKECLPLEKKEKEALSRICWLVLSPLYAYIQEIIAKETFDNPIHLIEKAITLISQPDTKEGVRKIKPSVALLVQWLLKSYVSLTKHEEIYRALSSKTILEPLREHYLRVLPNTLLIRHLASIPNCDGYKQSFRIAHEHLQASIRQLCEQISQPSDYYVEIEIPGLEPRQLKPEVIKGLIDPQTGQIDPYINSKKEYENCRHTVRSLPDYKLHLKERPDHPCMDYAVGALMHRLFDHGPPPTQLAKLTVTKNGVKSSYPVLFSRTVSGDVFNPEETSGLDPVQITEQLISQILVMPGDANARNFVRQGSKLISIDNDVCFVEPVVLLKEGWRLMKMHQVQFTSILFCLKNEVQLDARAIKRFCDLDPLLILNGWLEDLMTKEKAYTSLFSDVTERKAFLEKDKERSFTPSLSSLLGLLRVSTSNSSSSKASFEKRRVGQVVFCWEPSLAAAIEPISRPLKLVPILKKRMKKQRTQYLKSV